ncbi:MAG: AAA family ATPase [Deltaproteobacteria bacterium]|jgi:hypothetical protein|nr:AAA family ATPase [Deltaproteobacteria bacterium]
MAENDKALTNGSNAKGLLPDSADFLDFVVSGSVFVDKTDLISNLLKKSPTRMFFLSRPRRFGKTLLLDTIQNIANGDRTPFAGMKIGESDYIWERYPVIRLSFSRFESDHLTFRKKLLDKFDEIARDQNLDLKPAESVSDIDSIISKLSKNYPPSHLPNKSQNTEQNPANVVILIDEYDFPLLGSLDNPDNAEELRSMLRVFYSTIKDCRHMVRFLFVTGVTKFSKLSIFSGMNSIIDISMDRNFSKICGFTEEEIKTNFHGHILEALSDMKEDGIFEKDSTYPDFMKELEFWYNGYSWDEKTKVYNPFSVINCLYNKEFSHYWYNSGTSLAAYKHRLNPETYINILSNNLNTGELAPIGDLKGLKSESFLFQTGYVTIAKIQKSLKFINYILKCPNNEISYAIAKDFGNLDSPFPGFQGSINEKYGAFVDAFEASDDEECARLFSSLLDKFSLHMNSPAENVYQAILYILLNSRGFRATFEKSLGDGRIDIAYDSPSGIQAVIEIKRVRFSGSEKLPKLAEAPPSGSTLPGFQEYPEHVRNGLEKSIADAVSQILAKKYVRAFYLEGETRACAVAVHGWTDSMFRFYKVDWNSRTISAPIQKEQPGNEDAEPEFRD